MVATTYGPDPGTTTEKAVTWTRPGWGHQSTTAVIYCHGSGDTALSLLTKTEFNSLARAAARRTRVVLGADNAGESWGNDAAISRIDKQIDWLTSQGAAPKVIVVGVSMGAGVALAYTLAHPERVAAVAAVIPLLDLQATYDLPSSAGTRRASIDAAYPPAYNDTTHGPTHSPVRFATALPADMPIELWTSSDDPLATPATADAFTTLRPQTIRNDLGPLGHTGTAVMAATPSVAAFVARHT